MKIHKARVISDPTRDWHNFTTLCGRMSNQSADGINSTDVDSEVTCKFCLKTMDRIKPPPTR